NSADTMMSDSGDGTHAMKKLNWSLSRSNGRVIAFFVNRLTVSRASILNWSWPTSSKPSGKNRTLRRSLIELNADSVVTGSIFLCVDQLGAPNALAARSWLPGGDARLTNACTFTSVAAGFEHLRK